MWVCYSEHEIPYMKYLYSLTLRKTSFREDLAFCVFEYLFF